MTGGSCRAQQGRFGRWWWASFSLTDFLFHHASITLLLTASPSSVLLHFPFT
jgi:hypothetical protein